MPSLPMVGDELAGYRLQAVLGRGGMSVVYEAENPRLGSSVALKVLAPELATDDTFRARFLRESRVAASLNHPNVVPIYDVGSHDDLLYIAMRYVAGADLRAVLKSQQVLTPDETVLLIRQAARALDAAHRRGLVHRDVKPGNILIEQGSDNDDPDHVYLTDFGISKHAASHSGLTGTGEFIGTIDYIAPEQIKGSQVDGRADIYSLGCVLYECLTGRVPFAKDIDAAVIWAHVEERPTMPTSLRPALPPGIDDVMDRALAKDPDARYPTCRELVAAASTALLGAPSTTTVLAASIAPAQPASPPSAQPASGVSAQPASGASATPAGPAPSDGHDRTAPVQLLPGPPPGPPPGDVAGGNTSATPPGRTRRRLLAGLGALALVVAATGGWLIWRTSQSGSPAPAVSPMPNAAMHSPLMTALANANKATGLVLMKTCHPQGTAMVTCTQPYFAVQTVTFTTYPSLNALYSAYVADVRNLGDAKGNSIGVNFGNCLKAIPNGEASWNHNFRHPKIYSLAQSISGKLQPGPQAAGRVFCTIDNSGEYRLVWTEDGGRMLAVMSGGPHEKAWQWWEVMHHNIFLPGSPMGMKM
jgi:serine/threonine protein kinase